MTGRFCRLFIPITGIERGADGSLMITGAAPVGDDAPASIDADTAAMIGEMGCSRPAGSIVEILARAGRVEIRARVGDRAAIQKLAAGVYRGLGLWLDGGRLDHAALVDRPDAVEALAEGALGPAGKTATALTLNQDLRKMNLTRRAGRTVDPSGNSPLVNKAETRQLLIEALDRTKNDLHRRERELLGKAGQTHDFARPADQAHAMALIKAALATPMASPPWRWRD